MAQSGSAPAVHPRRNHAIEPNNGPSGPPILPAARFADTDWEARDVISIYFSCFVMNF